MICVARDVCSCVDKLMCALCMWILAHLGCATERCSLRDKRWCGKFLTILFFFRCFQTHLKLQNTTFVDHLSSKAVPLCRLKPEGKEEQRRRSSDDESDGGEYSKNRGKDETDKNWKFIDHHWNFERFLFLFRSFCFVQFGRDETLKSSMSFNYNLILYCVCIFNAFDFPIRIENDLAASEDKKENVIRDDDENKNRFNFITFNSFSF